MQVTPYLNFDGRCEEAIEFYRTTLGAEVLMLLRFNENPEPGEPGSVKPGTENKIMHSTLKIGDSQVMASDCNAEGKATFQGVSLSLTVPDTATSERTFAALSVGGQVQMPLTRTFFSPSFGVVVDKFGVSWMIYVPSPAPAQ